MVVYKQSLSTGVLFLILQLLFLRTALPQGMTYKGPTDGAGDPAALREGVMDGNRVVLQFQNTTELGMDPVVPHYSAWWPKGDEGQIMHRGVALIVTARVFISKEDELPVDEPLEIDRLGAMNLLDTLYFCQTHFRIGMDLNPLGTIRWGFYPVWGYFNPAGETPAMSTKPESWPTGGWPSTGFEKKWPGEWNGRFGRGIQYADLEAFVVANDAQDQEYVQEDAPVKYYPRADTHIGDINPDVSVQKGLPWGGLGLRVEMRLYQWDKVEVQDCIFMEYTITNCSDYDYPATGIGLYIDPAVGDNEEGPDDAGSFNQSLNLVYSWDFPGIDVYSPPAVLGIACLETPVNSVDGIDNDDDGLVDEKRDNQAMQIVDPYESISDIGKFLERYNLTYLDLRDHWDADEDQDWDDGIDLNNNGIYDRGEYAGDDVGLDGLGPNDINYSGPDYGECDHRPSFEAGVGCEPDFNLTDIAESDMLGVTAYHGYEHPPAPYDQAPLLFNDDKGMVQMFASATFDEMNREPMNLVQLISNYPFSLPGGCRQHFSTAELHSYENLINFDNPPYNEAPVMFQLKKIAQIVYEQDFRFAQPPVAPVLTATAGDGYVILTWDDRAEKYTREALLGNVNDFEGYKLYKATDADFKSAELVYNPLQLRIKNPIFQCDLKDHITGMSPYSNSHNELFYLGDDSGITHYFRDDNVQYGRTYYYALVAYDYGIPPEDLKGISGAENGLSPRENSAQILVNDRGGIEHLPVNCAVVVPGPKAAGLVVADDAIELTYNRMAASGDLEIAVAEPGLLKTGSTYYLKFYIHELKDMHFYYSAYDYVTEGFEIWREEADSDVPVYQDRPVWVGKSYRNSDYVVQNKNSLLKIDYELGSNEPVYHLPDEEPGISGIFDGLQLSIRCIKRPVFDPENSGWISEKSYPINMRISVTFNYYNSDCQLVFTDELMPYNGKLGGISTLRDEQGNRITTDKLLASAANFYIENLQVKDPETGKPVRMEYLIYDRNGSGAYEPAYDHVLVGAVHTDTWRWTNTLFGFDFIGIPEKDRPKEGAVYRFSFKRPFSDRDSISFTVKARETTDPAAVSHDMEKIRVVPNPYLFTNAMENHSPGGRRLMFTHLPQKCTIKIFTVSGYLIREIRVPGESLIPFPGYTISSGGIIHWDLCNRDGREVAPGMYFYQVRDLTTGKEKAGKFALIK